MTIGLFTRRVTVIEAALYSGDNGLEIQRWQYQYVQQVGHPKVWFHEHSSFQKAEVYDYLHRTWVQLEPGDWIVRGIRNEFYPVKADVFAETYEEVQDDGGDGVDGTNGTNG